jgi:hypothetical protein
MRDWQPSYLALHASGELHDRAQRALALLEHRCRVCPRLSKVDRLSDQAGLCRVGRLAVVVQHQRLKARRRAPAWDEIQASAGRGIGDRVALASARRAASAWARRWALTYAPRDSCASPKGLPSESLQIAHASPGWTTLPPSASTRSSASATSLTVK